MGIPKKGSRRIEAGGSAYRYMVGRPRPGDKTVAVTVQQDAERPGRVMQFRAAPGFEVTPEVVRDAVARAVSEGWDPAARGAAFTLAAD